MLGGGSSVHVKMGSKMGRCQEENSALWVCMSVLRAGVRIMRRNVILRRHHVANQTGGKMTGWATCSRGQAGAHMQHVQYNTTNKAGRAGRRNKAKLYHGCMLAPSPGAVMLRCPHVLARSSTDGGC